MKIEPEYTKTVVLVIFEGFWLSEIEV